MPNAISLAIACIHKIGDALPCTRNRLVHFTAFRVASSSLHIALEEMMIHRVQHDLWNLRAGRIVEKDESRSPSQRRESGANSFDGKVRIRS